MASKAHYARIVTEAGFVTGSDLENIAAYMLVRSGMAEGVVQQHRVAGFRLDFAWPDLKLALEVDGPTHFAPTAAARDAIRDTALRAKGWLVLRVDGETGIDGLREQVARVCCAIHALRVGGYAPW